MLGGRQAFVEVELLGAMYRVRRAIERSLVLLLEFLPIMRPPHELVHGWRSSLGDLLELNKHAEALEPAALLLWLRAEPQSGALSPGVYRELFNSRDMDAPSLVTAVRKELAENALLKAHTQAFEEQATVRVSGMGAGLTIVLEFTRE